MKTGRKYHIKDYFQESNKTILDNKVTTLPQYLCDYRQKLNGRAKEVPASLLKVVVNGLSL